VPSFKTLEEEARFWDTHDSTEYELEDTDETIELPEGQKAEIIARWKQYKNITIRLNRQQSEAIEKIARQKKIHYRSLIREWIEQHIADSC
jgi:predicted DNA binding CopG/RHH family protein